MQAKIKNEAPHEVFFKSTEEFFIIQSNYGSTSETIFTTHTKQFMPLSDTFTVAVFKVKPKKQLVVNSNMELVEEIIYNSKYKAA